MLAFRSITFRVRVLALSGVAACADAPRSNAAVSTADGSPAVPADVAAILDRHVARHEQWRGLEYRIERHGLEDGLEAYRIVDRAEERRLSAQRPEEIVPGGGTSFVVVYDARARAVVKHLHFQ